MATEKDGTDEREPGTLDFDVRFSYNNGRWTARTSYAGERVAANSSDVVNAMIQIYQLRVRIIRNHDRMVRELMKAREDGI